MAVTGWRRRCAGQAAPAADIPARHIEPSHEFTLSEEEVSDVSLATFYVFDKERATPPAFTLARACGHAVAAVRAAPPAVVRSGAVRSAAASSAAARSAPAPAAVAAAPAIVIQRVAVTSAGANEVLKETVARPRTSTAVPIDHRRSARPQRRRSACVRLRMVQLGRRRLPPEGAAVTTFPRAREAAPRPAVSIRRRRRAAMGTDRREPIETAG